MDEKIEMSVIALSKSKSVENSFVIVLEDEANKRRLPIHIGPNEAQYIGITLEKLVSKRPMTHDIIYSLIAALSAHVEYVYIHDIQNGIFLSSICIFTKDKHYNHLDARPSDAIAIAIKCGCPIYSNEKVLNDSATIHEIYLTETNKTAYSEYSISDLEELLKKVLEKEDYESAIRIRETIDRKKINS